MTDLSDYGVDTTEVPPPRIERKAVKYVEADKRRLVGFVGKERNRGMRVYTTQRSRFHYYRNGEGYAISEGIIDYLGQLDVEHIFIHEKPREDAPDHTPDAFEFRTRQYQLGESVPEADLYDEQDAQTYVPLDDAIRKWDGMGETMFVREFSDAMDYINSRSRGMSR